MKYIVETVCPDCIIEHCAHCRCEKCSPQEDSTCRENQQAQEDWLEVLKEIIKNCDMDTRTAIEKHFRQFAASHKQKIREEYEKKYTLIPKGSGKDVYENYPPEE